MLQKCLPCSSCSASACAWHKPLNRMFSQGSSSTLPSSKTLLSWWCRNFSLGWRWKDEKWPKNIQITVSFANAFMQIASTWKLRLRCQEKTVHLQYPAMLLQDFACGNTKNIYQNSKHGFFTQNEFRWIQIACPTMFEFDLSSPLKKHPSHEVITFPSSPKRFKIHKRCTSSYNLNNQNVTKRDDEPCQSGAWHDEWVLIPAYLVWQCQSDRLRRPAGCWHGGSTSWLPKKDSSSKGSCKALVKWYIYIERERDLYL